MVKNRINCLNKMIYDIFIIGGGINGCGIARDASGRGLKICLAEMDDLASGTSSASTKLIHGGLRYLKYFDFKLVKEALKERDVLLKIMPHICWPMRFLIPLESFRINNFFIRCGLFLYDYIAGNSTHWLDQLKFRLEYFRKKKKK